MAITKEGRLVQHGDNLVLVIDAEMLEQMKINADTPLEIVVEGASLIITVHDENHRVKLHGIMEEMNRQYGEVFRKLAE